MSAPDPIAPAGDGGHPAAVVALKRALAAIDKLMEWFIIAIMVVMIAIVSGQVFTRYVLNSSWDWADELSRLCFVWSILLAIPLALRNGGHILMELLVTNVSERTRDILYRLMCIPGIVMMALITWESVKLTIENWDETIPSVGLSGGLFFLAVAIGCGYTVPHLVLVMLTREPRRVGVIE